MKKYTIQEVQQLELTLSDHIAEKRCVLLTRSIQEAWHANLYRWGWPHATERTRKRERERERHTQTESEKTERERESET